MAKRSEKAVEVPDTQEPEGAKRKYLSQLDVPAFALSQALRVAQALTDQLGKGPAKPLRVAQAMSIQPTSSRFRVLCGASIAYGLTDGGYNSDEIALTALGRRIVAPTKEGDDFAAKREALLRPRVVRDFLTRYNESKLPNEVIGANVLEELGVPPDRTKDVYALIVESARELGYLREVKGQMYVDLDAGITVNTGAAVAEEVAGDTSDEKEEEEGKTRVPPVSPPPGAAVPKGTLTPIGAGRPSSRVFITHGSNVDIVAQLKDLLTFGGFTPVVAMEHETVSKPVPDKVMDDMRSCSAAIIHVGTELRLLDPDGKERKMLNQNVLIEVGAAMALYDRRFILLVEKDVTLPSNLQGLYEVRYTGNKLDYEATMKLLRAFNDFKS